MPITPLTYEQLEELEVDLCRSKHRPGWWATAGGDFRAAIGRMLGSAISTHQRIAPESVKNEGRPNNHPITATDIWKEMRDAGQACPDVKIFRRFVDGTLPKRPDNQPFYLIAKQALEIILLGSSTLRNNSPECAAASNRIISFFFNRVPNVPVDGVQEVSYWDSAFSDRSQPARAIEVNTELRNLIFLQSRGIPCRITRVSGSRRFPHFENEQLSDIGNLTIQALKAGVQVRLVYPKGADESLAHISAKGFEDHVKATCSKEVAKRVRCVDLAPGQVIINGQESRWSGEYLNKTLRWALYQDLRPVNAESVLTVARPGMQIGFYPSAVELADFDTWCKLMVWTT